MPRKGPNKYQNITMAHRTDQINNRSYIEVHKPKVYLKLEVVALLEKDPQRGNSTPWENSPLLSHPFRPLFK